ncbi:RNA polymerase sigma-70 factor (ECF subfamily) [Pullulanibacillus pueri]|uniref:RNA polymerase subunit sigma n=1 Tax=Pullulanibacillus pueri TaxID=1437324 RepID=A0A8J2ZTJ3_9BACL|nr:sigma-70 family RNA polymerase sigma factor [Pullulanibacillus pueri]MBM7680299.1 RNA polymerase sigma-70 factor (ECF subfamily) [Pullulanibacillus pueri]GGH75777.1 RNA polymerase subunit sigma [Pullulanibacillus pueri]
MNKKTFSVLFGQFYSPLYHYLYRMTGSHEDAEELLQETFYKAMLSLKIKNLHQTRAWLFKVARNLYVDWVRKHAREQHMLHHMQEDMPIVSHLGNPEKDYDIKERQLELHQLMQKLPERMRTLLYLREVEGFSYQELCATLELTMNQVKVTLHRAREKFNQYVKEQGE